MIRQILPFRVQRVRWGLLVYLDGQDRLLVNLFSSCIEKGQQAVLGHLVLVVEGFIGLLLKQTHNTDKNIVVYSYTCDQALFSTVC